MGDYFENELVQRQALGSLPQPLVLPLRPLVFPGLAVSSDPAI